MKLFSRCIPDRKEFYVCPIYGRIYSPSEAKTTIGPVGPRPGVRGYDYTDYLHESRYGNWWIERNMGNSKWMGFSVSKQEAISWVIDSGLSMPESLKKYISLMGE